MARTPRQESTRASAFVESGNTQVFIATHSPILMTFPGSTLFRIHSDGIEATTLEETSHYHVTRGILENPERYWKHLRATGESEG